MPLSYGTYPEDVEMEKPGPEHDLFRQWCIEQDVKINGVAPAKFPGRGIGIVAERDIKQDEELVFVPASSLLSTDSIVEEVKDAALSSGISVHGLLAMYLAVTAQQEEDPYAEWRRVWPSRDDLAGMPVLWPYALRGLRKISSATGAGGGGSSSGTTWSPLPPSVNGEWSKAAVADLRHGGVATSSSRLQRQRRKVDKDWARAKALCEGRLEYVDYLHHWLLVNTRSFFFDETEDSFDDRDDKMALCPFIDYFNHHASSSSSHSPSPCPSSSMSTSSSSSSSSSGGCRVAFNAEGYSVTADRAYRRGEELFVSYGDHDNDLLLADYGFVLPTGENAADTVPLDDIALFGPAGVYRWKQLLDDNGYFGHYRLGLITISDNKEEEEDGGDDSRQSSSSSSYGCCYRTQMAAAVRVLDEADWLKVVKGERELADDERRKVDEIIRDKWLATWLDEAERALELWRSPSMHDPKEVPELIRELCVTRWTQIQAMLKKAIAGMMT